MNQRQLQEQINRNLDRIQAGCPYDPIQQKNLWLVYNLGLYRSILARTALTDSDLRRELEQRADPNP